MPGHGAPMARERALAVLEEDVAYLEALQADRHEATLPAVVTMRTSDRCTPPTWTGRQA